MTSIIAEDLRVEFPIYGAHRSLRKVMFERAVGGFVRQSEGARHRVIVTALRGVSLELHDGDRLGLIGHNGAGKSTLLKALAGVYPPHQGRITVQGRITPLFEALPGLDREDTGYQNIITAGMFLGLRRDDIEKKIADIEQFSELGEYLSLPVRTYSAGMVVRLGFAVATAIEPDILLMDEGLGRGDARFAERAARRLHDFIGRSSIFVLASHVNDLLLSVCNKAALMSEGQIVAIGAVADILREYELMLRAPQTHHSVGSNATLAAAQPVSSSG
jgi:ABC-type polysaccharide/polyol phosphate transport system ATPase subunit